MHTLGLWSVIFIFIKMFIFICLSVSLSVSKLHRTVCAKTERQIVWSCYSAAGHFLCTLIPALAILLPSFLASRLHLSVDSLREQVLHLVSTGSSRPSLDTLFRGWPCYVDTKDNNWHGRKVRVAYVKTRILKHCGPGLDAERYRPCILCLDQEHVAQHEGP